MDSDDEAPSRQVLPLMPKLRGRENLDAWHVSITGKLVVDRDVIGSAQAQLFYIWNTIDLDVQTKYLLSWMQKTISAPSIAQNVPQALI